MQTNDDAFTLIQNTYETRISPRITHTPSTKASLIGMRRNISHKQFNAEALRLINASNSPTLSIDDLVRITHLACTTCGLILM